MIKTFALLFLFIGSTFGTMLGSAAQAQEYDRGSEMHFSMPERRELWIAPSVAIQGVSNQFKQVAIGPGSETLPAVELGLGLLSSSNRSRTVIAGLDLRQMIENHEMYGTRLGVRLEWRPEFAAGTGLTGRWYFGDTIVSRQRDLQFNGNSFAVSLTRPVSRLIRTYLEFAWGHYSEGPGFIYHSRPPGIQELDTQTVSVGLEFPLNAAFLGKIKDAPEDSRVRPEMMPGPYTEPL